MKLKIVSICLSFILITSVSASAVLGQDTVSSPDERPDAAADSGYTQAAPEIQERLVPFYLDNEKTTFDMPLYFINEVDDLPYIDVQDLKDLMETFYHDVLGESGYALDLTAVGDLVNLTRENGYTLQIDFQRELLSFDDYDAFIHSATDSVSSLIELVDMTLEDDNGNPLLLERLYKGSYDRLGNIMKLCLADYDIHLYRSDEDNRYLIPLHTIGELLLALPTGYNVLFNEEAVYIVTLYGLGEKKHGYTILGASYNAGQKEQMSAGLAWYNYCELCLLLDVFYGLKDIHDITSFADMFMETGLVTDLTSTDTNVADGALRDFIYYYLDDLHSGFKSPSYRTERLQFVEGKGISAITDDSTSSIFKTARENADHAIPAYEEVGNTAYITFDSFNTHPGNLMDYYDGKATVPTDPAKSGLDTIALIIDAHKKLCREDSPVENVVLDLSLNSGGAFDAAAFVSAWFLGEATIHARNSVTGAISTGIYRGDTNLDKVFDERDTVSDKHLFCLIGPYSFSCGNLVPDLLKQSRRVTLLGQTSGGGSCSVLTLSTASGALFQISSPYHMSFLKNGSYYDIDAGIDPDFVIMKPENFYDREALTEYINHLF